MAKLNFNGAGQEAMDDFSVVPAGLYNAQVVKSEIAETKAKSEGRASVGSLLKLQFKIIDGKFKGRIVFSQYNLENENAQAVEISRKQMKTLCDAIGKPDGVDDSQEMHNIPMQIKIAVKPAQGQYAEQNEIKFYSKYDGVLNTGGAAPEGGGTGGPGNPAGNDAASAGTDGAAQAEGATQSKAPWANKD